MYPQQQQQKQQLQQQQQGGGFNAHVALVFPVPQFSIRSRRRLFVVKSVAGSFCILRLLCTFSFPFPLIHSFSFYFLRAAFSSALAFGPLLDFYFISRHPATVVVDVVVGI